MMQAAPTRKSFTGRKMAAILVGGFGIVVAVNFYMASLAVGGFHGVVVDNSYVASQKFNGWLEAAEADRALGWGAEATRDAEGYVTVRTSGMPQGAAISAELRRPLGEHELAELTFVQTGPYAYRSLAPVTPGRWTMRMTVTAGELVWAEESELR